MQNKVMVIGLDGGTFRIIDPLIAEGKLPNIEKLINGGARAVLNSTIPALTPPAWISFMTGTNSGKHGFFDFCKAEKVSGVTPYSLLRPRDSHALMHSGYYAGNTVWDILSDAGYKVSVLMMPVTYPPWKINGFMLSGFPCPDFNNPSTYPAEWGAEIGRLFDISTLKPNNDEKLVLECKFLIKKQEEIILKQLKNEDIDVYAIVFSSTDFVQHQLWKYMDDPSSPYASVIPEIYMEIDKTIGKILEQVEQEDYTFMMLSDHGFTATPKKYFHPNVWLKQEGYLVAKDKGAGNKVFDVLLKPLKYQKAVLKEVLKGYFRYLPKKIQEKVANAYHGNNLFIWEQTKAFRYRLGQDQGIVINLEGRQPEGMVSQEQYEPLRDEIISKLKALCDSETGDKIVREVYKREELYNGPFVEMAPDIVLVLDSNYQGGVDMDGQLVSQVHPELLGKLSGVHERDGIFVLNGPKVKQGISIGPLELVDLLPTILFNMGLPIPKYVDGRVVTEALKKPFASEPINYVDSDLDDKASQDDLSDSDEDVMKDALRGLGYME